MYKGIPFFGEILYFKLTIHLKYFIFFIILFKLQLEKVKFH